MRAFHLYARLTAALLAGPLVLPLAGEAAESVRPTRGEIYFRLANPCPATGQTSGACQGYVIDRVIPLVCGGADAPENMQWQTLAAAKEKARWEKIGCRKGRKLVLPGQGESITESFAIGEAPAPVEREPLPAK